MSNFDLVQLQVLKSKKQNIKTYEEIKTKHINKNYNSNTDLQKNTDAYGKSLQRHSSKMLSSCYLQNDQINFFFHIKSWKKVSENVILNVKIGGK